MILGWIDEARKEGARHTPCCKELGLDPRTIQRWRSQDGGDDQRNGSKTEPKNKLSRAERARVLEVVNSREFRDKSPKQIVPTLADRGEYIGSESTIYRILREEDQLAHRGTSKPRESRPPREHRATGPNQVWSWDITYLRAPIAGMFFYLYMFVDVWSRKIVGYRVAEVEDGAIASRLLRELCSIEGVDSKTLALHQDNGAPMKGATFKATMDKLGITASFSRPRVSDDNPFSEALYRTLKCSPEYPKGAFESIDAARAWVEAFVRWYNHEHRHSAIGYVAPNDRHEGRSDEIIARRRETYEAAKRRNPERWGTRATREWSAAPVVYLNPTKETREAMTCHAQAA